MEMIELEMSPPANSATNQKTKSLADKQARIERELGEVASLPPAVRQLVKETWKCTLANEKESEIQLFAQADLDASLKHQMGWVVLGRHELAWIRPRVAKRGGREESVPLSNSTSEPTPWEITSIRRERIKLVKESPGLSLNRVTILGEDADCPLFVLRYTNRQKRAMSHIVFVLEQALKASGTEELVDLADLDRFRDRRADEIYSDALLAPLNESQSSDSRGKSAVVFRLLGYLWPHRRRVVIGMSGALLMTLLGLVPPFLTGRLIDEVIKPVEQGRLQPAVAMRAGLWTISILAMVFLLRELFAWVRLRWMSSIGESVASDLREAVYNHLHRLSLSYFSTKQTGSLINRVSSDTDRIWDFVAFGVVEVATSVLMLMGLSGVLIYLDWRLGLLVTVPIPFLLGAIVWHGQRMQDLFLRAWRKWSHLTDCLSDTIPGVRVVKAFNREEYETKRFSERNQAVFGEFLNIHAAWTSFWPALMLGIQLIVLLVWCLGLPRVLGVHGAPLRSGEFVSFILYMTMFMQPIEVIGQMARMVNRATSSAYRVFEVLDTEPQMRDEGENIRLEPVMGDVEFANVYFSYDGVRPILSNLSFSVRAGEMIGLVGPSGSGKTTVTNLLARFFDVLDGQIKIDGVDLRDLESGHFRRQVGMVLQDPYLFHGSILENIRYANPDASLNEVIQAAKVASAHSFVSRLPHGYDTIVGERGHTLSGGERQRISIARAVLLNPRILILDEATSAVDTETERQIQQALDRLVKGRTVFAIAHRLSTLTRADRLLVIKSGRLVESGTHAELLKIEGGVFAGLYQLQQELHASSAV